MYAESAGLPLIRLGKQYGIKDYDSLRIDPEENLFCHHSSGTAGSVIDFVMFMESRSLDDAIRKLRKMLRKGTSSGAVNPSSTVQKEPEEKQLELPPRWEGKYSRIYAYLTKTRGIAQEIVTDMVQRKQLYEDNHHNAVFVGLDKSGTPGYGFKRSTATNHDWRGDVSGSSKDVGFLVEHDSTTLLVTEAAIDSLSQMTLLLQQGIPYRQFDYLALGGTSLNALYYHLMGNCYETIVVGTDYDAAGILAAYRIKGEFQSGYQIRRKPPPCKDWNEALLHDPAQPYHWKPSSIKGRNQHLNVFPNGKTFSYALSRYGYTSGDHYLIAPGEMDTAIQLYLQTQQKIETVSIYQITASGRMTRIQKAATEFPPLQLNF